MTLMLSRKDVSAHKIAPSNDANQEGQMFAVTGITGQVGGVVARVLLAAGLEVRGVVRDPVKGEDWANQGCEVAVAEMNDAVALARAFDGAEAVFILLPPNFDPAPGFPEYRMASGVDIPITEDELDYVWSFHGGIFYHGIRRCAFGTSTDHELSQTVLDVTIDAFINAAPHAIGRFTAEAHRS
jgi:hypothetical protein